MLRKYLVLRSTASLVPDFRAPFDYAHTIRLSISRETPSDRMRFRVSYLTLTLNLTLTLTLGAFLGKHHTVVYQRTRHSASA
jgi:hypothetical protein